MSLWTLNLFPARTETQTWPILSLELSRGDIIANPTATCNMSNRKVLDSTELLGLILGFAGMSTCACLVSTSRNFFEQGIIHIWKNLPTAKRLILLIPGAHEVESGDRQHTMHVSLSDSDPMRQQVEFVSISSLLPPQTSLGLTYMRHLFIR